MGYSATVREQNTVRKIIRKHIHTNIRNEGMMMWEQIDRVDVHALADELIAWADKREKRHAGTR